MNIVSSKREQKKDNVSNKTEVPFYHPKTLAFP